MAQLRLPLSWLIVIFAALFDNVRGALVIKSDFEKEFLASEGTKKFFFCEFDSSDVTNFKKLEWQWNQIPILTYDFQTFENKFHQFPMGIQVNEALSGRERLGLVDMTTKTTGVLKCTLEDVYGKSVSKETFIRVVAKGAKNKSGDIRQGGLEREELSSKGSQRTVQSMASTLIGSMATLLIGRHLL